ncbi:hypothetical protein [Chitinophaga costaii]|nr:hypothetical protein [Chitinophaga costaii]
MKIILWGFLSGCFDVILPHFLHANFVGHPACAGSGIPLPRGLSFCWCKKKQKAPGGCGKWLKFTALRYGKRSLLLSGGIFIGRLCAWAAVLPSARLPLYAPLRKFLDAIFIRPLNALHTICFHLLHYNVFAHHPLPSVRYDQTIHGGCAALAPL